MKWKGGAAIATPNVPVSRHETIRRGERGQSKASRQAAETISVRTEMSMAARISSFESGLDDIPTDLPRSTGKRYRPVVTGA